MQSMTAPNAMVVSAQPEASEAGAEVLMRGGNAVDAAIAAALVQGVVDLPLAADGRWPRARDFLLGKV